MNAGGSLRAAKGEHFFRKSGPFEKSIDNPSWAFFLNSDTIFIL